MLICPTGRNAGGAGWASPFSKKTAMAQYTQQAATQPNITAIANAATEFDSSFFMPSDHPQPVPDDSRVLRLVVPGGRRGAFHGLHFRFRPARYPVSGFLSTENALLHRRLVSALATVFGV
jgi:hypothetical protein